MAVPTVERITEKIMKRCQTCLERFKPKVPTERYCGHKCFKLFRDRTKAFRKYAVRSSVRYEFRAKEWYILLRKMDYRCVYCRGRFGIDKLTIEHIVPLSRGGTHSVGNVAPCCESCNKEKGDKTYVEWKAIRSTPIFNSMVTEHRRVTPKKQRLELRIDKYGHRGV